MIRMMRELTQQDKDVYLEMTGEFYTSDAVVHDIPKEHCEATFEELMRSDQYAKAYILEEEGKTAGYVLLSKTFSQEAGGLVLWVEELYLRPEFQGKGLGSKVLTQMDQLLGKQVRRLRLETEPDNERARDLYCRLGYSALPYLQMIKEG